LPVVGKTGSVCRQLVVLTGWPWPDAQVAADIVGDDA